MKRRKVLIGAFVFVLVCVSVLLIKTKSVFDTNNVSRITFYAYYGSGKGSNVSEAHMSEIVNWLDSFTAGKMAFGPLPPGTNTVYVEIEYLDGTIVKQGLNTVDIGWFTYYTRSGEAPDCFWEILSKTDLSE